MHSVANRRIVDISCQDRSPDTACSVFRAGSAGNEAVGALKVPEDLWALLEVRQMCFSQPGIGSGDHALAP